jgi:hypothetical protein
MEAHYLLSRADLVERVSPEGCRRLHAPDGRPGTWRERGPGRHAVARMLLLDATERLPSPALVRAFCAEILAWPASAARELQITVAEVRAWRAEREEEVDAQAARPRGTLPELLAEADREIAGGPRAGWLLTYRTIHATPRLGSGQST